MPEVLRRMHLPGHFRGVFTVRRGRGIVARLVGWLSRFPPAGEGVATELSVVTSGGHLAWLRRFGAVRVETTQWGEGSELVEYFKPVACHFRLETSEGELRYVQSGARLRLGLLRVPLPRWMAPRISGVVRSLGERASVDISIAAPLLGEVLGYRGEVWPEEEE